MDNLISRYEIKIVEPGCAPGSGKYGLQLDITNDISPVFPYINALLNDTLYDHQNAILIWREKGRGYALRAHEIRIAHNEDISDPATVNRLVGEIVSRLNSAWNKRDSINPRFTSSARPAVIDLFNLLPRTNCKQCGCITCLVFAAELREGKMRPEQCPPLLTPEFTENLKKLREILGSTLTIFHQYE